MHPTPTQALANVLVAERIGVASRFMVAREAKRPIGPTTAPRTAGHSRRSERHNSTSTAVPGGTAAS
jgi:hypothetical protein